MTTTGRNHLATDPAAAAAVSITAALADPNLVDRLVARAMNGPDPLAVYEARAVATAEQLDDARRKLAATPDHEKAQTVAAAALLAYRLAEKQLREAQARRDIEMAAAHLAAWSGHRQVFLARNIALVLWAPMVAGVVLAAWALALALVVLGLFAFIVTFVVCRRSDRIAREVSGVVAGAGLDFAEYAWKAGVKAMGPLKRGSRADLARRLAACEAASAEHEEALLTLIAVERGMPYTAVYPLAELDAADAERIELAVYAEIRAWREQEKARAAEEAARKAAEAAS